MAHMAHDPELIADAILHATSGFARVGITQPDGDLRRRAALDMAMTIADRLDRPQPTRDARQMPLPL